MRTTTAAIEYPERDGKPMSDNTLQFRWIVTLQGGLDALFRDRADVFVAGDLLWYPVEGKVKVRQAPDVMVAFGRPKGDRGSYRQWDEGGVAPQVVFEVMSPGNRPREMARKLRFYEKYGVEEYYIYDPDRLTLTGHVRDATGVFEFVREMDGYVSPRLGVRFDLSGEELVVYRPDGKPFQTYVEIIAEAEEQKELAERERRKAERERKKADAEQKRATAAEKELERLRAKLRAAGIDPDTVGS